MKETGSANRQNNRSFNRMNFLRIEDLVRPVRQYLIWVQPQGREDIARIVLSGQTRNTRFYQAEFGRKFKLVQLCWKSSYLRHYNDADKIRCRIASKVFRFYLGFITYLEPNSTFSRKFIFVALYSGYLQESIF